MSRVKLAMAGRPARIGQRFQPDVVVTVARPTPIAGLEVTLTGTVTSGRKQQVVFSQRVKIPVSGKITSPQLALSCAFDVPADAPPSYDGKSLVVAWQLAARADIPWWPDAHGKWEIRVQAGTPPRPQVRDLASPGQPSLELHLPADVVPAGRRLEGVVALSQLAPHEQRGLQVALVGREAADAGATELLRLDFRRKAPIAPGKWVPFHLEVPRDAPPTLESRLGKVEWTLHATAKRDGRALTLSLPITVVEPVRGGAPRMGPTPAREPLGAQWQEVAAAQHLALVDGVLTGEHAGAQLTIERGPGSTPNLVGIVRFRSLRIGLDVALRKGKKSAPLLVGENTAYMVNARNPAQSNPFLTQLGPVLRRLPEVRLADDSARFTLSGPRAVSGLSGFATQLRAFAAALASARNELAPPVGRLKVARWKELAASLGGDLEPGDYSVRTTMQGRAVEVVPRWELQPRGLELRVQLAGDAVPPGLAKRHPEVTIESDVLSMMLTPIPADLLTVEPLLRRLCDELAPRERPGGPYR